MDGIKAVPPPSERHTFSANVSQNSAQKVFINSMKTSEIHGRQRREALCCVRGVQLTKLFCLSVLILHHLNFAILAHGQSTHTPDNFASKGRVSATEREGVLRIDEKRRSGEYEMEMDVSASSNSNRGVPADEQQQQQQQAQEVMMRRKATELRGATSEYGRFFNVYEFGAVGDGKEDDTDAFVKAFAAACESDSPATVIVENGGTFLVGSIYVEKCHNVTWLVYGTLVAPEKGSQWSDPVPKAWFEFAYMDNMTVSGYGTFDGRGEKWWKKPKENRPMLIQFKSCDNLYLSDITAINSPEFTINLLGVTNSLVEGVTVLAPENSRNTDGIHLSSCNNLVIRAVNVSTGDDNISIQKGTTFVLIEDSTFGYGHGVSIGSLGQNRRTSCVSNIVVQNCIFDATDNGMRIKTWVGGQGSCHSIVGRYLTMINVGYPIRIDQNYCINTAPCLVDEDAVVIYNVTFDNIYGTYGPQDDDVGRAAYIEYSSSVPCILYISNVSLQPAEGANVLPPECTNVYGFSDGTFPGCELAPPSNWTDVAYELAQKSASKCP